MYQKRAFPIVSLQRTASVNGARYMLPLDGNSAPPGFK